jgi:hypothetical protein
MIDQLTETQEPQATKLWLVVDMKAGLAYSCHCSEAAAKFWLRCYQRLIEGQLEIIQ